MKVSIIVPIYITNPDLLNMTKKTLEDLKYKTAVVNKEIIIVNDASPQTNMVNILKNKYFPEFIWLENKTNKGFAHTVNLGMAHVTGDLILLLNNDVEILDSCWLDKLIKTMYYFKWDMTAPVEGWIDNKTKHYIPYADRNNYNGKINTYLVGWCLLIKKQIVEQVGLMPTNYGKGFWEDVNFCDEVKRAGFNLGVSQNIPITHKEHTTFKNIGINLTKEYLDKRDIYIKIANGQEKAILPKISDYRKEVSNEPES